MKNPIKWYQAENKQPDHNGRIPCIFTVQEDDVMLHVEGWFIYNIDKGKYCYVSEKVGGGWTYYDTEKVKQWREYGKIETSKVGTLEG